MLGMFHKMLTVGKKEDMVKHKDGFVYRSSLKDECKSLVNTKGTKKTELQIFMQEYEQCDPNGMMLSDRWKNSIKKVALQKLCDRHKLKRTGTNFELWDRLKAYHDNHVSS